MLFIAMLGFLVPVALYPLLRRLVRLTMAGSVSIAAHYGSVSAGTFTLALALAESSGILLSPEATRYLVLLEIPALVLMLWWYQKIKSSEAKARTDLNAAPDAEPKAAVWHEALTALLIGGVIIAGPMVRWGLSPYAGTARRL